MEIVIGRVMTSLYNKTSNLCMLIRNLLLKSGYLNFGTMIYRGILTEYATKVLFIRL